MGAVWPLRWGRGHVSLCRSAVSSVTLRISTWIDARERAPLDASGSDLSPSGVAAPVQVVQVILGPGAVGSLLLAVLLGALAMAMLSAGGAGGAGVLVVLGLAYLVGAAVLRLRIKAALAEGNREARDLLTALICVDVLATVLLISATGSGGLVSVVVDCAAAALLWLPASARWHFGDPPLPRGAAQAPVSSSATPSARPAAPSWTSPVGDPITTPIPTSGYRPYPRATR